MRVLHAEPDGEEAAELARLDESIGRFWQAGARLGELGEVGQDLRLEPGLSAAGQPLSLLRSSEPSLRPLIERVLSQAPAELAPRFSALQPRLGLEQALADVRSRTGVDLAAANTRAGFSRGHLLDVSLF